MFAAAALACAALFFLYYIMRVVKRPRLHFSENDFHLRVLQECPALSEPYFPTMWCFNNHLMLLVLLYKEFRSKEYKFDLVEHLKMKDGGVTGLAWSGLRHKPESRTPVVLIFHTISGDEQDVKGIVQYVTQKLNWIAVVCIRRGHGSLPVAKPPINTMGSTSDLAVQISNVQKRFPRSPLFGIGISAGSGLLARYLGEAGAKSRFTAAAAVSPAYDIEKAFHRIHPFYSKIMGQRMINYFLKRHYEGLSQAHGFSHAMGAQTLGEFQDRIHAIAGFESRESYYHHSNPIKVAARIRTPLLVLNSSDDPICVNLNVMENLHWLESLEHTMLVHTNRGSHIAYLEGMTAKSWSDRVVGQYFQAVLKTQHAPVRRASPSRKRRSEKKHSSRPPRALARKKGSRRRRSAT